MSDGSAEVGNDGGIDAVELEILRSQLEQVAEEMGELLIRAAYSPNITERRDCSTALFDARGRMVAQAEHIPVHLGAMPEAVDAVLDCDPQPGDVFVLNDPFQGGTHLPDVTLVSTIPHEGEIIAYAVSRAHHADVGGMTPGSMPAGAREIQQEGLRIPPVRLVAGGERNEDVESLFLANVRNPEKRRADLRAQLAANERAETRLLELLAEHERALDPIFEAVIEYSRERMRAELREIPDGEYRATDVLEGDGVTDEEIHIEATVTIDGGSMAIDFAGTAGQVAGNVNAPLAVAKSAVYFVLRCVTDPDIPPNHGCYEPITVRAPAGSLLNPDPPAAVVGGNVETSQRVTDVVFAALGEAAPERVPAQGQGTMNNLIIGSSSFTYYETIGGGSGANPGSDGLSGVQVGMTNTLNTPVEALEGEYPLRVEQYALRDGTGGAGRFHGGDGLVRSVTVEEAATVSLLTDRRANRPSGVAGGEAGTAGRNLIDGEVVPAKLTREVPAGTTVTVETPGGGGYGPEDDSE
ncbi:hydantoinase B/oxoprolinase family protein [Halovenus sp. HT40]|uniref:hydantoinase B/oxoprolinase family protein n=1 Tax=Halovenus sp. HT40 TaxID=3126691 RepID=UPI00300E7E7F